MRAALSVVLALCSGCKVVDAPENLEDLMVYSFEHYDDRAEHLIAAEAELEPLVDELYEDLSDGYRVSNLTAEDLELAGVEDPQIESIIGAVGAADYRHELSDVLIGVLYPDKDEIYDKTVAYDILEETDLDCFLADECEYYDFTFEQTVSVVLLGDSTQTVEASYRWVHPEEAEPFVVARLLSPTPIDFSTSIVEVDQQYSIVFMYPWADTARRVESIWAEARVIGLDVPDSFAVDNAAGTIADQADRVDDYLDTLTE